MNNDIDTVLSSVMNNEELLNKIKGVVKENNGDTSASLSSVISMLAPEIEKSKSPKEQDVSGSDNARDGTVDSINSLASSFSKTISRNAPLLLALKPYLNNERSKMVDDIVKISQLADVLRLL